jgi:hypothetical protein
VLDKIKEADFGCLHQKSASFILSANTKPAGQEVQR